MSGKGGIQANWRAVTGINTTGLRIGVSGGNRGGVQAVTTQDYSAAYKGIGIETSVDFEAQYAGMGFDDVKAIGAQDRARSLHARRGAADPRRQYLGAARHHADAVAGAVDLAAAASPPRRALIA